MTTNHDKARDSDASVDELRDGIEQTRKEMSETLGALEQRLSPEVLGEKAKVELDHLEARVKSAMKEGIEEAKAAVGETIKEGVKEAKEALTHGVHEAKEAVSHGLKEARETVKSDLSDAITQTKHNVREATLGRVETFATKAGDVMNDTRDTLVETIRQNPIPAALAGIGIAWLLMNRSSRQRRGPSQQGYPMVYGASGQPGDSRGPMPGFAQGVGRAVTSAEHAVAETVGNAAHRVGDMVGQAGSTVAGGVGSAAHRVGDLVGQVGSTVAGAARDARDAAGQGVDGLAHMAHDARDAAGRAVHAAADAGSQLGHTAMETADHLAHQAEDAAAHAAYAARQQAARVESSVASAWEANPLAFGAAALLAGAAMGYALPRTEKEDELVGELRDRVVSQAATAAGQAVHSLEHMAEDAGKAAKKVVTSAAHS